MKRPQNVQRAPSPTRGFLAPNFLAAASIMGLHAERECGYPTRAQAHRERLELNQTTRGTNMGAASGKLATRTDPRLRPPLAAIDPTTEACCTTSRVLRASAWRRTLSSLRPPRQGFGQRSGWSTTAIWIRFAQRCSRHYAGYVIIYLREIQLKTPAGVISVPLWLGRISMRFEIQPAAGCRSAHSPGRIVSSFFPIPPRDLPELRLGKGSHVIRAKRFPAPPSTNRHPSTASSFGISTIATSRIAQG